MHVLRNDLSRAQIAHVVEVFYGRVRADAALGPIFDRAVHDWTEHLERLTSFWCTILFGVAGYKGNPLHVHLRHVAELSPALFTRWLEIWQETTSELLSEPSARLLQEKASRMSQHLQAGLFGTVS